MHDRSSLDILNYHHSMLEDEIRSGSFLQAILHTVRPGDIVLEIGSGTGILAMFACLAGAKHVYAVEQGAVIEIARSIAQQNGYQDRITFLKGWSTEIELPALADVLVTETIGNIGFDEGLLGWVIDAKKRLLTPNARIIPQEVEMIAVPVESRSIYSNVGNWRKAFYSFDFSPVQRITANNLHWGDLSKRMYRSHPACIQRVDLENVENVDIHGSACFTITRAGMVHGIGCWFATELTPGVRISNAPPNPTPSWTHGFLPLEQPLLVKTGDKLRLEINTTSNSTHWGWQVTKDEPRPLGKDGRSGGNDVFQNTESGYLYPRPEKKQLNLHPKRNYEADLDLQILQRMDGVKTVNDIVLEISAQNSPSLMSTDHVYERIMELCNYYGCEYKD